MELEKVSSDIDRLWTKLRSVTPARIGLARSGSWVETRLLLDFQLAHAEAQDAVKDRLDADRLISDLKSRGLDMVCLSSKAPDRKTYLARPDFGRELNESAKDALLKMPKGFDVVFVLCDGLSADAVMQHATTLLDETLPSLLRDGWSIGPVAIVEQGRVAIGDEIGQLLQASLIVVLIGERPGLTSPKSLGVYLTWTPRVGRSDAERNCLSNVRPEGMSYREAADRLTYLCREARSRQLTGVNLKDDSIRRSSVSQLGRGGHWRNWVGNQSFIARHKAEPGSEDELAALVQEASRQNLPIRVAGSGHSFTPVVATSGLLLSLENMQGLVSADLDPSASSFAQARGSAILAARLKGSGYRLPIRAISTPRRSPGPCRLARTAPESVLAACRPSRLACGWFSRMGRSLTSTSTEIPRRWPPLRSLSACSA